MPLLVMSANIQDGGGTNSPSRKRSLKDYLESAAKTQSKAAPMGTTTLQKPTPLRLETKNGDTSSSHVLTPNTSLPLLDAPDSPLSEMSDGPLSLLTDGGSSTPAQRSPSPHAAATPCKSSGFASPQLVITIDATPPAGLLLTANGSSAAGTAPPPAKRKRLTPTEREEKAKADAARKLEKERAEAARKLDKEQAEAARKLEKERIEAAKKQEREEQKAAADAKKKAIAQEKETKRKQKEEEDRRKADEKEKKRREKEEEERKFQEAKDKKERSQLRLNSFFKTPTSSSGGSSGSALAKTASGGSPLKASTTNLAAGLSGSPRRVATMSSSGAVAGASSKAASDQQPATELSEYERIFKPFFVKENVIMATSLFGMDDETKEAKSRILDEYLSGTRGTFSPAKPFSSSSAVDYFHLPCNRAQKPLQRGRGHPSVRKIMKILGSEDGSYDEAQSSQTKLALDLLKSVPMKYLFFREDVRPAYFGTVTSEPPQARLSKLARNPLAKTVLPLNYDYDSEAEWVDDGDGEDVDGLDDEEEELDDDGEMSDFLDDSEDAMPLRPAFSGGGMEPESTGLCWENERRRTPHANLESFRMEFILGKSG